MTISKNIKAILNQSSWIRKMFEEGTRLKKIDGPENVYDFSLGNPNLNPPKEFIESLKKIVNISGHGEHAYMPNAGYPHVKNSIAAFISKEHQINITGDDIIMTCGAAGALNVILKAILDAGDEVLTPAPYFVEYGFYANNHGGILKAVPTNQDFTLNVKAIADAITKRTRAVIINSPNNPTGQIYSEASLAELGAILKEAEKKMNTNIYLISDEPYRKIVYDDFKVPSIFKCCDNSIIVSSYSKDISIPGERIGFIAINPNADHKMDLLEGMTLANRILGFVNAPALMQRVVAEIQGISVDISEYARKKRLLCEGLSECGYDFITPRGAFYLFPKTPIPDDVEFVIELQKERILTVPGSGFGGPGYFRIAFCVDDKTIINSMPGFRRAIEKINR
jgi:aspartate aminotransferase